MKPIRTAALLVFLLPALVSLQGKTKQPIVPAVFNNARYIYVEAVDGQQFDPRLYPEDRQAIADVQDAMRAWNRYMLTMRRDQADLVIVVRKGRAAEARTGVNVGMGPYPGSHNPGSQRSSSPSQPLGQPGTEVGVDAGGEIGSPDDLFEICQLNGDGTLRAPLWMRMLPGGLDTPQLLLVAQFKDAVERAYPSQPAKQTSKP